MDFNKAMLVLAALLLIVGLWVNWPSTSSSVEVKPAYQQNQMTKDGCVMQNTPNGWIKTCG